MCYFKNIKLLIRRKVMFRSSSASSYDDFTLYLKRWANDYAPNVHLKYLFAK